MFVVTASAAIAALRLAALSCAAGVGAGAASDRTGCRRRVRGMHMVNNGKVDRLNILDMCDDAKPVKYLRVENGKEKRQDASLC